MKRIKETLIVGFAFGVVILVAALIVWIALLYLTTPILPG